jgi:hypothetical protein
MSSYLKPHSDTVAEVNKTDVLSDEESRSLLTAILTDSSTVDKMHDNVPSYMVPTAFVPLRQIPQSIVKKTDRVALHKVVAHLNTQELRSFYDAGLASLEGKQDPISSPAAQII